MKKKLLSLVLAFTLSLALAVPAFAAELKSFRDVPSNHWAHAAIMDMVSQGLLSGTTSPDANGVATFNPDGAMNRSHFVMVIARYLYGEELAVMPKAATWYGNAYTLLVNKGILKSSDFNNGKLEVAMSRQEMAYVLAKAADAQGKAPDSLVATSKIPDYNSISSSYKDSVVKAYSMGLIAGTDTKGTFNANGTLNRAQASTVIYRLVNYNGEVKENKTPSSTIPSGIISAEQWNPENMTKTMAKADELINKYGEENSYGEKGVNKVNNKELLFGIRNSTGTVQMYSFVDNNGLHIEGYDYDGNWVADASLEYVKTLISETTSTAVATKATALLQDLRNRSINWNAEADKLNWGRDSYENNEKFLEVQEAWETWYYQTFSDWSWDLGEGCYLSSDGSGFHIYTARYAEKYPSLIKSYDSYTFMKSGQK